MAKLVKFKTNPGLYEYLGGGVVNPLLDEASARQRGYDPSQFQEYGNPDELYGEEINSQVSAQVDPTLKLLETNAAEEKQTSEKSASRLQEELKKVFEQRAQADPYARSGVVSGAANAAETDRQVKSTTEVQTDLASKLSNIARRLSEARLGVQQQGTALKSQLRGQYLQNTLAGFDDAAKKSAISPVDLGDRIQFIRADGTVVREVRKGLTPSASAARKTGTSGDINDDVASAIGSGQYTATGEQGKLSREALIDQIYAKYGGKVKKDVIATQVYSGFRGGNEQVYSGLDQYNQSQANQKPLSGEAAKNVSNAQAGLKAIQTMRELIGRDSNTIKYSALGLPKAGEYSAATSNAIDVLGRLRSGGAISESEEKRFAQILKPSILDNKETVAAKLGQVEDQLNNLMKLSGGQQQQTSGTLDINALRSKYGY